MANRDLFREMDAYDERRREPGSFGSARTPWQVFGRRMLAQAVVAMLLFCGVVYLYEQESALGDGVRYIVALASADEQEIMAVGSFADIWQGLLQKDKEDGRQVNSQAVNQTLNNNLNDDLNNEANNQANNPQDNPAPNQNTAASYQPDESYLQSAPANANGDLVMILPASGLMQGAFGDIDEQGLSVDGLKIFCQNQQEVKAAAIGEVVEVVSGEKIVLRHRDGVESCYLGAIEPEVQVGETLRQGQLLGKITESTLLFQVLRNGQPQDPFLFVKGPE